MILRTCTAAIHSQERSDDGYQNTLTPQAGFNQQSASASTVEVAPRAQPYATAAVALALGAICDRRRRLFASYLLANEIALGGGYQA